MRDLGVLLILLLCARLAWRQPWAGVLGLTVFAYLQPHAYATGWMHEFPVYKALVLVVFAALLRDAIAQRALPRLPLDWRVVALAALGLLFVATTYTAIAPWRAWPRLEEVSKTLLTLPLLTLLLIDSRHKLHLLIATIAGCFALLAIKGGYWAIQTGFSDRVYGPPGSHFFGNNQLAVAVIMNLPLLALLRRQATDRRLRGAITIAIGLTTAAALSSWSRGALIALIVTGFLLAWHSYRKPAAVAVIAAIALAAAVVLPADWFARMDTIAHYEQDQSASSRLAAWKVGLQTALENPWTGVGFEGWRVANYWAAGIDWHNSYIEVLAEHGIPGLLLWLALLVGSIVALIRLEHRARTRAGFAWATDYAVALRIALIGYSTGAIFLGLAYWNLLFHLLAIAIVLPRLPADTCARPDSTVKPDG